MDNGPRYGYLFQLSKCVYICKKEDKAAAAEAYARHGLTTSFSRGQAYLGGRIGSQRLKAAWLEDKVTVWTNAVVTLASVARRYPQSIHAAVTLSL